MIEKKPDILEKIQRETHIELKQRGRDFWGLCPFHEEKTPSFKVDPERQTFHCFGCSSHGDVITFIQKYKGLSFREALSYLGISNSRPIKPSPRELLKRKLTDEYRNWMRTYEDQLCTLYRGLQGAKNAVTSMLQVEAISCCYHGEPLWEHHLNIVQFGTKSEKLKLYEELIIYARNNNNH